MMAFNGHARTTLIAGLTACALLCNPALGRPIRAATQQAPIPFESASVREAGGGFLVTWRAPGAGAVKVYAARGPQSLRAALPAATAGTVGRITLRLPAAPRWYFELDPVRGAPLVIAPRSLHISATNARDAGGYRTRDGDWVRMGEAYRSDALVGLTRRDIGVLEALHVRTIVDLRTAAERRRWPDATIRGATVVDADVLADDLQKMQAWRRPISVAPRAGKASALTAGLPTRIQEIYRDFVRQPSARRAYHALFLRLADPASLPVLFHCTAGKDRTGWGQAVLMTILGVPRPVIMQDYLLSNHYLAESAGRTRERLPAGVTPAQARRLMRADPADLRAAFAEVQERYGSFDRYLRFGLGLDDATLAAIRRNFLTR